MYPRLYADRGFSLTELMLTLAVTATLVATALPVMTDVTANIRLNEATRLVERELQYARLKAVSANQPLRLRTNCPAMGMIRVVEVLGTAADTPVSRCDPALYKFPAPDDDVSTRPNHDGPVKLLPAGATVSTWTLQFNPDGTVWSVPAMVPLADPVSITVTRQGSMRSITVNGVGKIQIQ